MGKLDHEFEQELKKLHAELAGCAVHGDSNEDDDEVAELKRAVNAGGPGTFAVLIQVKGEIVVKKVMKLNYEDIDGLSKDVLSVVQKLPDCKIKEVIVRLERALTETLRGAVLINEEAVAGDTLMQDYANEMMDLCQIICNGINALLNAVVLSEAQKEICKVIG